MRRIDPNNPNEYQAYDPSASPPGSSSKSLAPVWIALAILLGIAVLFCGGGALFMAMNGSPDAQESVRPSATPSPSPNARRAVPDPGVRPTPTPTKQDAPETTVGDGTYLVGDDIPAGTYKSAGAEESLFQYCGWSVRASESSEADYVDLGSASKTKEPQRVKLKRGQVFETGGCGDWKRQP